MFQLLSLFMSILWQNVLYLNNLWVLFKGQEGIQGPHIMKFIRAPFEIWKPWHPFFGNPEKLILGSKFFDHKYAESDVILFLSGFLLISNFTKLAERWHRWNFKFVFLLEFYLTRRICPPGTCSGNGSYVEFSNVCSMFSVFSH